jgi:integrin beta 2
MTIGDNVCKLNNGGCEQLCLQSPQSTVKCACADGFKLNNDNTSCLDIGKYFTIIMQVGNYSKIIA